MMRRQIIESPNSRYIEKFRTSEGVCLGANWQCMCSSEASIDQVGEQESFYIVGIEMVCSYNERVSLQNTIKINKFQ